MPHKRNPIVAERVTGMARLLRADALVGLENMNVRVDRMRANLDATNGALYSQRALLALVEGGRSRDEAYRIVQRLAQRAWDTETPLRELLAADPAGKGLDLADLFDPGWHTRHVPAILERL